MSVSQDLKKALAATLVAWAQEQNLSQVKLSQKLVMTQPRLSDLLNGKLEKFSLEFLVDLLYKAGYDFWMDSDSGDLIVKIVKI